MHTTPVSLLERVRQPGEQEAWSRFVDIYTPLLYFWACRMGLQESDAADLVQEVFTILVVKLPDFVYDRDKSFRGWLRTILFNKIRDKRRRRAAEPPVLAGHPVDEAVAVEVEAFWEIDYRHQLVGRALELMQSEFQPTTWRACWEVVVSSRSAGEVAAELGISVDSVYAAKSRVLRRLRKELEGLFD
jgi:RNA polymerase sigma-70 factor (ECF subfamily)